MSEQMQMATALLFRDRSISYSASTFVSDKLIVRSVKVISTQFILFNGNSQESSLIARTVRSCLIVRTVQSYSQDSSGLSFSQDSSVL